MAVSTDNAMEAAMTDREEHTPKEGFALVGIDDFEDFGEQLYTIEHFDTIEKAQAALKTWKESEKDDVVILYPANSQSS